jgi:hypothetical protein
MGQAGTRATVPAAPREVVARFDDPWMRTLILAPSVTHSLSVAGFAPPPASQARDLFAKPTITVANVFSTRPAPRHHTERFAGSAVAFVPTITFTPAN